MEIKRRQKRIKFIEDYLSEFKDFEIKVKHWWFNNYEIFIHIIRKEEPNIWYHKFNEKFMIGFDDNYIKNDLSEIIFKLRKFQELEKESLLREEQRKEALLIERKKSIIISKVLKKFLKSRDFEGDFEIFRGMVLKYYGGDAGNVCNSLCNNCNVLLLPKNGCPLGIKDFLDKILTIKFDDNYEENCYKELCEIVKFCMENKSLKGDIQRIKDKYL